MELTFEMLDTMREEYAGAQAPNNEDMESWLDAYGDHLRKDPLLLAYAKEQAITLRNDRPFVNSRAWHSLAERSQVIFGLTQSLYDTDGNYPHTMTPSEARGCLVFRLKMAAVYLWRDDIQKLATTMPVPRHVIAREQMQHPMMFFSFERASPLLNPGLEGRQSNWVLFTDEGAAMSVFTDIMPLQESPVKKGDAAIKGGHIKYGATYPDDFSEETLGATTQYLAWMAFLNSPYVDSVQRPIERQMRRHLGRKGLEADQSMVSVITLRRRLLSKPPSEGNGEARARKNRWWVSGHIRAQWYPSLQGHKLIWVAPYLKGPGGKPIRDRVYEVKR